MPDKPLARELLNIFRPTDQRKMEPPRDWAKNINDMSIGRTGTSGLAGRSGRTTGVAKLGSCMPSTNHLTSLARWGIPDPRHKEIVYRIRSPTSESRVNVTRSRRQRA
jgi:hypothetical protein